MTDAQLCGETDLAGFRKEAGQLLAHQVPPEAVQWQAGASNADFYFDSAPPDSRGSPPKAATAIVPASFLRLTEMVLLHSDPARFDLLYRLLWRLVYEPGLRHDAQDAQMLQAQQMGQAVRRDLHRMKTALRFRNIAHGEGPLMLAWYEPAHHIVEALGPWFARRHAGMRWAILSPQRCIECDGRRIHAGPGLPAHAAPRDGDPPDAWLAAYRAAFGEHGIALPAAPPPP